MLKLQNWVTGGYCDDEEQFLSLAKFNQVKDNFVLLGEFYDEAKGQLKNKDKSNTPKNRNIFSMVYMNQNLKKLPAKEGN